MTYNSSMIIRSVIILGIPGKWVRSFFQSCSVLCRLSAVDRLCSDRKVEAVPGEHNTFYRRWPLTVLASQRTTMADALSYISLILRLLTIGALLLGAIAVDMQAVVSPRHAVTHRHLQANLGFNGTLPEEVCDSVLERFYLDGFVDRFQTRCTCVPRDNNTGGYLVTCVDYCHYCVLDICSLFTATLELDENFLVETLLSCDEMVGDDELGRVKVCLLEDYISNTGNLSSAYYVNAEACNTTGFVDCPSLGDFTVPLVDCSNAGFGMSINFCEGDSESLPEPFNFLQSIYYLKAEDYSIGTCTPSVCGDKLGASNLCTETELTLTESEECAACFNGFVAKFSRSFPDSCMDANVMACDSFKPCRDMCGTCTDAVEDFGGCLFAGLTTTDSCTLDCTQPTMPPTILPTTTPSTTVSTLSSGGMPAASSAEAVSVFFLHVLAAVAVVVVL